MLSYCLHAEDEREREKILVDNMGNNLLDVSTTRSVTRLDILPNLIRVFFAFECVLRFLTNIT